MAARRHVVTRVTAGAVGADRSRARAGGGAVNHWELGGDQHPRLGGGLEVLIRKDVLRGHGNEATKVRTRAGPAESSSAAVLAPSGIGRSESRGS